MTMRELFNIFWSFLKIGAFTFGGGYAMIPLIQHEVIHNRRWLSEREFVDLLTLAQAALLGVVVPSFVIILLVAIFFNNIRQNPWVDAAFRGMRPAVVALIVAPIVGLTKGMHWMLIAVALAVAVAVWYWGISPILFLVAGAFVGILIAAYRGKEAQK